MQPKTRSIAIFAVATTFLLTSGVPAKDATDEFAAHFQRIETTIAQGDYKSAKRKAAKFEREMLDRIIGGPRVPEYLGEIAKLHAIALAGLDEMDHAAWKWQMAEAIYPQDTGSDLASFGDVGKTLQEYIRSDPILVDPMVFGEDSFTGPVMTKRPDIRYPEAQGKLHLKGSVKVQVVVGVDGRPHHPKIMKLSGRPIMAYATLSGLRRWRFDPATIDGEPVNSFFFLTMSF